MRRMEEIIHHLKIPVSLAPFHVDEREIDGLVKAGMQVTRLLSNNKKTVTPEDARRIYQEIIVDRRTGND